MRKPKEYHYGWEDAIKGLEEKDNADSDYKQGYANGLADMAKADLAARKRYGENIFDDGFDHSEDTE